MSLTSSCGANPGLPLTAEFSRQDLEACSLNWSSEPWAPNRQPQAPSLGPRLLDMRDSCMWQVATAASKAIDLALEATGMSFQCSQSMKLLEFYQQERGGRRTGMYCMKTRV